MTLRALHDEAGTLLNVMNVFITEPLLDWVKPAGPDAALCGRVAQVHLTTCVRYGCRGPIPACGVVRVGIHAARNARRSWGAGLQRQRSRRGQPPLRKLRS